MELLYTRRSGTRHCRILSNAVDKFPLNRRWTRFRPAVRRIESTRTIRTEFSTHSTGKPQPGGNNAKVPA